MDLFNLIRAPNLTKVKVGSRSRAPHEVPLLTLNAPHVIKMDKLSTTDSSGVSSTIERSPLDFANEAGASDQGATAPEIPSSKDVPTTVASGVGQAEEAATMDPPTALESRKRGHAGTDVNAPQSHCGGIMLTHNPQGAPYNINLARQVAMGSQLRLRFEQEAKLLRKSVAQMARQDQRIQARELEIKNLEARLETETGMKKATEDKSAVATLQEQVSGEEKLKAAFEEFKRYEDERVEQRCAELDARLDALSIDFDEELYPHMLTAIAGRRWVIGHELRLAMMKCAEYLEMRQAFTDVVSTGVAKGMSEGLKHGVEHGHAQLKVESIEAYDPEAEAKFVAALQSLQDLKYPLLDQLEGLKDAPMDVIMAALYLESDTGEDAPQYIRDLRPSSSQLTIPVYPEVRDPRNPWAYKEEINFSDAIATNITRAEKKKKYRIACRTHGVGSAHHARSDGVLVSAPTVVPQGLALLLVDTATQTDLEDLVFNVFYAPWESWLFPNVLGIALRTRSPRPLGLQPAYATNHVQRYIAPGITASVPYVREKGVSPWLDLIIVRWAQRMWGSSSTQFLFLSPRRALIHSPRLLFALSTSPLDCGCLTDAKRCVIFSLSHQSLNGLSANCLPLSEIISPGSERPGVWVEHGHAQLKVESIEAYHPEAEAKFVADLQSLQDLKYHLLDQLEGLKGAPMDVIMTALYLESDTREDAPQYIRDLRPSSSQLTIPVYPEVRDPRNPWAYKEEINFSDAIAVNITRAEKKKKCRIACRTHGVGSAHHARSDGISVSAPTVVPQGLALLLVDAATQTDLEDLVL
nr:transposase (putative), gypsy type [Tanacetum cinerariifolium]